LYQKLHSGHTQLTFNRDTKYIIHVFLTTPSKKKYNNNNNNNKKLAGQCRGPPWPKLRFMVGEDKKIKSVELEANLA
jgi:hypothetical protein